LLLEDLIWAMEKYSPFNVPEILRPNGGTKLRAAVLFKMH